MLPNRVRSNADEISENAEPLNNKKLRKEVVGKNEVSRERVDLDPLVEPITGAHEA